MDFVADIVPASRTRHFLVEAEESLVGYLAKNGIEPEKTARLLDFGAIYLNRQRLRQAGPVKAGDYLRVHPDPKRYPIAGLDWAGLVLCEDPDFVIVNKPVGLPVHASLDNARENLVAGLSEARGEKLYVTQRLDTLTSGLVFFARTERAQVLFNRYLAERKVHKRYLALTEAAPPIGRLVHFMVPSDRAPHQVSAEETPGSKRCELVIQTVKPTLQGYQSEIELITGRTHQVRVQFAAEGCPLIGDTLYGGAIAPRLGLHAFRLSFLWKGVERAFELAPDWAALLRPPSEVS